MKMQLKSTASYNLNDIIIRGINIEIFRIIEGDSWCNDIDLLFCCFENFQDRLCRSKYSID